VGENRAGKGRWDVEWMEGRRGNGMKGKGKMNERKEKVEKMKKERRKGKSCMCVALTWPVSHDIHHIMSTHST